MPFNGSGTFNRVMNWVADATAGVKIRADRHDQEDDGFAAGLSMCLTKDGQTTPTGPIKLGGQRLINVGDPTAAQDAVTQAWVNANVVGGARISDTPPTAKDGELWWESDSGNLYIRYNDGTSTQFVQVNVASSPAPVAWEKIALTTISGAVPNVQFKDLSAFQHLRFAGVLRPAADAALTMQISSDNGATWDTTTDYTVQYINGTSTATPGAGVSTNTGSFNMSAGSTVSSTAGRLARLSGELASFNQPTRTYVSTRSGFINPSSAWFHTLLEGYRITAAAHNAIQFLATTGNIAEGYILLEGVRS